MDLTTWFYVLAIAGTLTIFVLIAGVVIKSMVVSKMFPSDRPVKELLEEEKSYRMEASRVASREKEAALEKALYDLFGR